jgi:hypothetical protein
MAAKRCLRAGSYRPFIPGQFVASHWFIRDWQSGGHAERDRAECPRRRPHHPPSRVARRHPSSHPRRGDTRGWRSLPNRHARQWSQRADHIAAISDQDLVSTFQGGDQRSAVPPGCSEFESCAEALRQDRAYGAVSIVSAHRVEILRARHQRSSVRWLHSGQVGGLCIPISSSR